MLYANTDVGSSALWVLDNDGVVVDNISIYGAERAPILEQINEHYGTSFTGWSDNEIGLRFGDSLPNWNAYEKIEMAQPFLWKWQLDGAQVSIFGKVENSVLSCYASSLEKGLVANSVGLIVGSYDVDESLFTYRIKPKLVNLGVTYTSIAYDTSTYSVNDNVENWDDFTDIT